MKSLNMKKVAVAVACLLLITPATLAQSTPVQAFPLCRDGQLVGVRLTVTQPASFTLMFNDVCYGRTEAKA